MRHMKEEPTDQDQAEAHIADQGASGWVTTGVAAQILGLSQRTVRGYVGRGELQAKPEGEGKQKRHLVSLESIHALREQLGLPRDAPPPAENREEMAEAPAVLSAREFTGFVRDLTTELVQKASEAAELRTRLELAERSENNLREQLRQERERAERLEAERDRLFPDLLREKDRANAERDRAEHFEGELRAALAARRGWFRRFFGF